MKIPSYTWQIKQMQLKWLFYEIFNHPPYSPDLAPSSYFLLLHIKLCLHRIIDCDDEIKNDVTNWFKSQTAEFLKKKLVNWSQRQLWRKIVNKYNLYVLVIKSVFCVISIPFCLYFKSFVKNKPCIIWLLQRHCWKKTKFD